MKIFRLIILCFSIVLLAISTFSGILMNYLYVFLLISALTMFVTFIIAIFKKQIYWRFSGEEFEPQLYVLRGFLRSATWIIIGVCVHIAVVPIQFPTQIFTGLTYLIWASVVVLCILDWIPRKQVGKSLNVTLFLFLIFLSYQLILIFLPANKVTSVELAPPFKGDWYVFHGGNSALLNHHHFAGSQKFAMDIIIPDDGKLPMERITDLQRYKTFGEPMFSPVDGVIVAVKNSLPDQQIGKMDRNNLAGNYIVIKTETNIFILIAHLQSNSVLVEEGDSVRTGQEIAKAGNSGNTTQPHLHIQAMTSADFMDSNSKPVPISFKVGDNNPRFYKRNDIIHGISG